MFQGPPEEQRAILREGFGETAEEVGVDMECIQRGRNASSLTNPQQLIESRPKGLCLDARWRLRSERSPACVSPATCAGSDGFQWRYAWRADDGSRARDAYALHRPRGYAAREAEASPGKSSADGHGVSP